MINFRKAWCKTAKKGSWWWKLLDCQRYSPAPTPVPPVPPPPEPPPPPPPVIPKCDIPYHLTGRVICYSGLMLTDLCSRDNVLFQESLLPAYYDRLAKAGVNAIRSFLSCRDSTPGWQIWQETDPGYYDMLRRRLQMLKDRELTAIVSLTPYGGNLSWDGYRSLISVCQEFAPNVVFEVQNEPTSNDLQKQVVGIMKDEFRIEDRFIQLGFVDSSDFFDTLSSLKVGLACQHNVATLTTINWPKPDPRGWAASPGTMGLMALGMYGSNDGHDAGDASAGDLFYGLSPLARRPTISQLFDCAKWMFQNGKGYEHLSAKAFLASEEPNIRALTEFCWDEAVALRKAEDDR